MVNAQAQQLRIQPRRERSARDSIVRHLYAVPDRQVARAKYVPVGRTLHIVDVENLVRGPHQPRPLLRLTSNLYRDIAPVQAGDHVVVATNPKLTLEAGLAWPYARLLMGGGRDGADLELIQQIKNVEWVASRFDRVIIGSGDGIFTPSVLALRAAGIAVGIVAPQQGLSYRLARSATFLRLIPSMVDCEVVA